METFSSKSLTEIRESISTFRIQKQSEELFERSSSPAQLLQFFLHVSRDLDSPFSSPCSFRLYSSPPINTHRPGPSPIPQDPFIRFSTPPSPPLNHPPPYSSSKHPPPSKHSTPKTAQTRLFSLGLFKNTPPPIGPNRYPRPLTARPPLHHPFYIPPPSLYSSPQFSTVRRQTTASFIITTFITPSPIPPSDPVSEGYIWHLLHHLYLLPQPPAHAPRHRTHPALPLDPPRAPSTSRPRASPVVRSHPHSRTSLPGYQHTTTSPPLRLLPRSAAHGRAHHSRPAAPCLVFWRMRSVVRMSCLFILFAFPLCSGLCLLCSFRFSLSFLSLSPLFLSFAFSLSLSLSFELSSFSLSSLFLSQFSSSALLSFCGENSAIEPHPVCSYDGREHRLGELHLCPRERTQSLGDTWHVNTSRDVKAQLKPPSTTMPKHCHKHLPKHCHEHLPKHCHEHLFVMQKKQHRLKAPSIPVSLQADELRAAVQQGGVSHGSDRGGGRGSLLLLLTCLYVAGSQRGTWLS
ncbi:hypothetical protein C7M84_009490 [Penaeus vannamei]|uniref:Uncharacterized protein n=1 Tax=Penaeus vannamei TaxID=6689 RepID=A0A423T6L0_PENVA|nr:hypothetical protein C7M84_009490 [Penaeus vannamei]